MPVFQTFAKRVKQQQTAGAPDVYQYDTVPAFLRRQFSLIFEASLGNGHHDASEKIWQAICTVLEREVETFPPPGGSLAGGRCLRFLQTEANANNWLSVVELICVVLHHRAEKNQEPWEIGAKEDAASAIVEINTRFRQSGFGYQFENGRILKVDEQFVHGEVVKPALTLLAEAGFEKANEDFLTAHRHYRAGENKDAIVAANRAFESTLKAICKARSWEYPEGARARELVTRCRNGGLFPTYLDGGLDTYIAMMKTGLPGVRNSAGGHGDDPDAPDVPGYMAAYAIHMTATNILLVINADRSQT